MGLADTNVNEYNMTGWKWCGIIFGPIWAFAMDMAHLLFDIKANGYNRIGLKIVELAIGLSP